MDVQRRVVLLVCGGNAARNQIAEAVAKNISGSDMDICTACVEPSNAYHVREFADRQIDFVVTIGERARGYSADFIGSPQRLHWDIHESTAGGLAGECEDVFRGMCEEIRKRLVLFRDSVDRQNLERDYAWKPGMCTEVTTKPEWYAETGQAFIPERHIPLFAESGFSVIEVGAYSSHSFPWRDSAAVADLGRIAEKEQVAIWSLHPPDSGNLCSCDSSERTRQIEVVKHFIGIAEELGAAAIPLHVGMGVQEIGKETVIANAYESLSVLADFVCDKAVTLCIETLMGPPRFLSNKDAMDIMYAFPPDSLSLVFDTGHANVGGDLHGIAARAGGRLKTLHIHDNDGKDDLHLIPGRGNIHWASLMKEISDAGYGGPLMLEVSSSNGACLGTLLAEARKSADFLLRMNVGE